MAVLNVAVTDVAADAMMLQVPVPLQAPDHPANVEPLLGVAVRVIAVPAVKLALHVCPQLMPAGALLTVPDPLPALTTLIWMFGGVVVWEDPQPARINKGAVRHVRLKAIRFFFGISIQVLSDNVRALTSMLALDLDVAL